LEKALPKIMLRPGRGKPGEALAFEKAEEEGEMIRAHEDMSARTASRTRGSFPKPRG